jgi:DNA (cytosine-5)-methyltransferase 1
MLTVGSLFSGIGGFDLGLERAGMRVVWQCESDDFCRRVLAEHWPDVPRFEDVRGLSSAAGTPQVDVLCGGFPCQGLSNAGLRLGLLDPRSGLWSEFARLVGDLRPRYVVVENVAGLLVRGLGRVLGDLAALGYDAEWDCLPASAFGAHHERDRIWLVAYPNGDDGGSRGAWGSSPGGAGQSEPERPLQVAHTNGAGREQRRGAEPVRAQLAAAERGGEVAHPERIGRLGRSNGSAPSLGAGAHPEPEGAGLDWRRSWEPEPDVGRVAHGVPARVDRLRSLGNALVPQIAAWIGRRIVAYEEGRLAA